jgi:hypothetical protein
MVNRGARTWGPRLCAAVLAAFLVTALLGACSSPDPHRFDKVNAVADELRLSPIGERYGTGNFSDAPITLFMVVAGPDAYQTVLQALAAASFKGTGTTFWERGSGKDQVTIFMGPLRPGDTYPMYKKGTRTVDTAAVGIQITNP